MLTVNQNNRCLLCFKNANVTQRNFRSKMPSKLRHECLKKTDIPTARTVSNDSITNQEAHCEKLGTSLQINYHLLKC